MNQEKSPLEAAFEANGVNVLTGPEAVNFLRRMAQQRADVQNNPFFQTGEATNVHSSHAMDLLNQASIVLEQRAKLRDKPDGERVFANVAQAYNALFGTTMTASQAAMFMMLLKIARSANGEYHADDYVDIVGYAALVGEEASKETRKV